MDIETPEPLPLPGWLIDAPEEPEAGHFELALVLGGTVSAGAYTAGVIDFLAEALDCMDDARAKNAKLHQVTLKVITGTSGGAVTAAIAARALAYDWRAPGLNPFRKVWVEDLTLQGFLATDDLANGVKSLLSAKPIDDAATFIEKFTAAPRRRSWVAEPLTTIVTLGSLQGVPCTIDFGSQATQTYVNHADYLRFAVSYNQPCASKRKDEVSLSFEPDATAGWSAISCAALASSAFPLGFPVRKITRPSAHYDYRAIIIPKGGGQPTRTLVIKPDWLLTTGIDRRTADYSFDNVDGGVCDNEPVALARTALLGIGKTAPRSACQANRAVILIDPFAGKVKLTPTPTTLKAVGQATLNLFKQQTRYDTADLALAADQNVFSRFMIVPVRRDKGGREADIACGGLGAFMGFASEDFREHDFQLGRANCQAFLAEHFVLRPCNKVFNPGYVPPKPCWSSDRPDGSLPIIPLFGKAAVARAQPAWPRGRLDPEIYRRTIARRAGKLIAAVGGNRWRPVLAILGWAAGPRAASKVIDLMNADLKSTGLT